MKTLCLLILIISNVTLNTFAAETEIESIKQIFKNPRRDSSKTPWQEHAEDLKPLGDKAIPLLATLLEDYWLCYDAAETMLVIDSDKAAPFIFASMPRCDRNVQRETFRFFNRGIQDSFKYPFISEMHDAAKRCLESQICADAAEEALITIGLIGSEADFPLLERYYNKKDSVDIWNSKLPNAAEASLARIGHTKFLKNIEDVLTTPATSPLPSSLAYALENAMMKAGFSQNPRLIPLLANHLNDPPADIPPSDVAPPDPAGAAKIAIYEIVNHVSSGLDYTRIKFDDLDKWWTKNKTQFNK